MATKQLTAQNLKAALDGKAPLAPGRWFDKDNLYLSVSPKGAMSWVLIWNRNGKRYEAGLGSATGKGSAVGRITLAQARGRAALIRAELFKEVDVVALRAADRKQTRAANTAPKVVRVTFEAMLAAHIDACSTGAWKNPAKEGAHWSRQLNKHAAALMGMAVADIETTDVVAVLKPHWPSRQGEQMALRIRAILNTAAAQGHLTKRNPADAYLLKGFLKGKHKTVHYTAMDGMEVPALIAKLTVPDATVSELAMAFHILTAARPSQTRLALRSEIEGDVWTIPAGRMKGDVEHAVPLSTQALAILDRLPVVEGNPHLFPGRNEGQPIADLNEVIKQQDLVGKATVHAFRSSFADYIGEEHNFDAEDREFALAHQLDATQGAYRRRKALKKRRPMMQAWADHCFGVASDKVVPLKVAA